MSTPSPPSRVLGTIGEFDSRVDNITAYLERLQLYFEANEVKDDRKVAVLLTVIGARTYDTLRSILAPAAPREKTLDDLIIIIIIIIIISHASIGADIYIYKKKKRKESKQEQSRPVADWTLSLRQPRAYGLLDQPLDCSQSEMEKKRLHKQSNN